MDQKTQDQIVKIACIVSAIGAINWYLASMNYNVVNMLVGDGKSNTIKPSTDLEKIAYLVVGLSGVICLWKCCSDKN